MGTRGPATPQLQGEGKNGRSASGGSSHPSGTGVALTAVRLTDVSYKRTNGARRSRGGTRALKETAGRRSAAGGRCASNRLVRQAVGGLSSSSCFWNGITPGTTHLFHISSTLLWK